MRFQHVDPLADTTVGWLLDEWLHRVRLISCDGKLRRV